MTIPQTTVELIDARIEHDDEYVAKEARWLLHSLAQLQSPAHRLAYITGYLGAIYGGDNDPAARALQAVAVACKSVGVRLDSDWSGTFVEVSA